MAKVYILRCRKCWSDEDVQTKKLEDAQKNCLKCGEDLYHHATTPTTNFKSKKRWNCGGQDVLFSGMKD